MAMRGDGGWGYRVNHGSHGTAGFDLGTCHGKRWLEDSEDLIHYIIYIFHARTSSEILRVLLRDGPSLAEAGMGLLAVVFVITERCLSGATA